MLKHIVVECLVFAGICVQQPSSNYDDSGFFSIQVLQKALNDWNLELVLYSSSCAIAQEAMRDPW